MAVELALWLIVTGLGVGAFVFGGVTRQNYIFILGCALLIGSGGLLWGFDGLLLEHQVSQVLDSGVIVYSDVTVTMSNVGLTMLALVFIALGVISMFVINLGGDVHVKRNTYHY